MKLKCFVKILLQTPRTSDKHGRVFLVPIIVKSDLSSTRTSMSSSYEIGILCVNIILLTFFYYAVYVWDRRVNDSKIMFRRFLNGYKLAVLRIRFILIWIRSSDPFNEITDPDPAPNPT